MEHIIINYIKVGHCPLDGEPQISGFPFADNNATAGHKTLNNTKGFADRPNQVLIAMSLGTYYTMVLKTIFKQVSCERY